MNMGLHLKRMFAYDAWANKEAFASLAGAVIPPEKAMRMFAHIIGAEWLWLGRLQATKQLAAVWPELTFAECREELAKLDRAWSNYFDDLAPDRLGDSVSYVNTKGETWTSRVEDVLLHVVAHSTYHRGQIASIVRAGGREPAYTDFIHAVRQGYVQ